MILFDKLSESVARHLLPVLEQLGFHEIERRPGWYGGGLTFAWRDVSLDLAYDTHDVGLMVTLGTPTQDGPIRGREYHLYTAALGIPTDEFKEACGGWRPGFLKVPELDSALGFVAMTLPYVLPHQENIQAALRDQPKQRRRTANRRKKKPGVPSN